MEGKLESFNQEYDNENEENKETEEEISSELLEEIDDSEIKKEAENFLNDVNKEIKKPSIAPKAKHAIKTAALIALLAFSGAEAGKGVADYVGQEKKVSKLENNFQESLKEKDGLMLGFYFDELIASMPEDMPHLIDARRIATQYLKFAVGNIGLESVVGSGFLEDVNQKAAEKFGVERWPNIDVSEIENIK